MGGTRDWTPVRASDTGQKPAGVPDSILFEIHRAAHLVRIKRGKTVYIVPLHPYEQQGDAPKTAARAARNHHEQQ